MICFRNLYLWYSDTTSFYQQQSVTLLWFAFEIYIFGILIQPLSVYFLNCLRCDLLSKFISLVFWYNNVVDTSDNAPVVICFRNLYLWYSDTTQAAYGWRSYALWFAFEIYIFGILIQRRENRRRPSLCCDLLSKFISLVFWYNSTNAEVPIQYVVICFRNLYLWYSDTT